MRWKFALGDGVGARVQQFAGGVEVVTDDEAATADLGDDEPAELDQVHDVGVLTHRGEAFAELGERHDWAWRVFALARELCRTIALCGPQPRLEQSARRIED